MNLEKIIDLSLEKKNLTREQCLTILNWPDEDILTLINAAYRVRKNFFENQVYIQRLTNAKSGYCSEDCSYCSQSSVSQAKIDKYPLIPVKKLLEEARLAYQQNAKRYCMALSGIKPSNRDIDKLCQAIRNIKAEINISLCCSLGFISTEQAQKLKDAGLDRVNHNLNTSRNFYPNICTTHSFDDRLNNLELCKNVGLEICSGGIVGQGESKDDIFDFMYSLKKIEPDSIPINFLMPIKGTPFEKKGTDLTPYYCLKVLILARFLFPDKDIRAAGGREYHLRSLQPLALYVINSIFVSGYLTIGGQSTEEALSMIQDVGFEYKTE